MNSDEYARRLASLLRSLADRVDMAGQFRQGIVSAYVPGPPRRVTVELDDGLVPNVPLLEHHTAPVAGEACWIVRVREGGWLYHGQQG